MMRSVILDAVDVAFALAGLGAVGAGVWMIYPPAAYILTGALAIAVAYVRSRGRP